jgi:class 3 adenylate cyclase
MEAKYAPYDFEKSRARIDEILNLTDNTFEVSDTIPPRDKLTYSNGYYVNCSAIFVDIRGSSDLTDKHRRPKLARLYRAFLSEVVAVINGNVHCQEINIVGDCVSGIFNAQYKHHINSVFETGFEVASLIDALNCKFRKKDIQEIEVGIGMSYGRALMIQAGYKGSGINDVVWMGDVVNHASNLCSYAFEGYVGKRIMLSSSVYANLTEHNQGLVQWYSYRDCYTGDVISKSMNAWVQQNC